MNVSRELIHLVLGGVLAGAQNRPNPSEVTINPIVHKIEYCLGPTSHFPEQQQPSESDITLRISLKLLYENHGPEPIIVPLRFRSTAGTAIQGQKDVETVAYREDPFDSNVLGELTHPAPPYFIVIPSGKSEFAYLGELVDVPVRSSSHQLLGKVIQLSLERDHGLVPSPVVQKLQGKWKDYGLVWTGIQDSSKISISIPQSPATVDCRKNERF